MTRREMAKADLHKAWRECVESGDMTTDMMAESLWEQISGECDMSGEEMTDERADLMGWDISEGMTDEQADEWLDIVNESAVAFLTIIADEAKEAWDECDAEGKADVAMAYIMSKGENRDGAEAIVDGMADIIGSLGWEGFLSIVADYEVRDIMAEFEAMWDDHWEGYEWDTDSILTDNRLWWLYKAYRWCIDKGYSMEDAMQEAIYIVAQ